MNAKQIWQTTIERLQAKVQPAVFTTWFQGTAALSFEDSIFVVGVPTTFAKAHLEGRFIDLIRSILVDITGGPVEVRFVVAKETFDQAADPVQADVPAPIKRVSKSRSAPLQRLKSSLDTWPTLSDAPSLINSTVPGAPAAHLSPSEDGFRPEPLPGEQVTDGHVEYPGSSKNTQLGLPLASEGLLNKRYTFSTFIVGKSNEFAHAVSLRVSRDPGRVYNPLFFYGGVGLGKTHLLHAIGHVGESSGLNVLYVTSEKFTNEIINAIRYQKTEEFRIKYRQIDILLVDDIQFIAGKESTEEEFFHTFNTLHNANKQIVVTSDRPPKAIHSLQDRLRSRFEWGLLADIQPPEYEHRVAILRSKAESLRFAIPMSVIEYIARPDCGSVRELEGALNRVIGNSKPPSTLTIADVLVGICRYYNVDLERLKGKERDREIVWPRQVAMYVMREETSASLFQIGMELGGRDHTTIMHGWEKVHSEVANNDRVRREIAAVLESLYT